jgi:hypothetical protein
MLRGIVTIEDAVGLVDRYGDAVANSEGSAS